MGSKILYMLPALVLAFLALVLALVGLSRDPEPVTVTATETTGQADQEEAAPSYEYWVLRQPLNAGEALSEENLAVVTSPTQISDALSAEETVFGRELRRYARPGELLSSHHLESGGSLPANLPEGQRAIAIAVDDVVGAGGLLQPGDRVDVALTRTFTIDKKNGESADDVEILQKRRNNQENKRKREQTCAEIVQPTEYRIIHYISLDYW